MVRRAARIHASGARVALLGLVCFGVTAASIGVSRANLSAGHGPAPASSVPTSRRAAAVTTAARSGGRAAGSRAVCSPREPFAPPVVASLAPGVLALDKRLGLAIVVSSATTARATVLSVTAYNAATGAPVRSRRITSGPVARMTAATVLNDDLSAVVDEESGRIFVLHAPYGARQYPRGRLDVLDTRTLTIVRRVSVGRAARPPVVDERTGRVFVANEQDGTLDMLNAHSGRLLHTIAVARGPVGPSAPPVADDATGYVFFAVDTQPGSVVALDARSGAIVRRVAVGAYPRVIGVDRRDNRVLAAGDGGVDVLDARSGTRLHTTSLVGTPRKLLVDELGRRAFISYSDNINVTMLDTATGAVLRTTPVRLDHTLPGQLPVPDQAESETYPIVERVDEQRRWVVVRVPQVIDDDGPEQGPSQIAVLDSRTATRIHTVFSEPAWPDAVAVDDRRGRAFSNIGDAIDVYDISCLTSYYIFGDIG